MMVAEMTSHTLSKFKRYMEENSSSKPDEPPTKPQANTGEVVSADSRTEAERLRVRVEELQAQVRQRDIKIAGLESQIEELRGKLATGTGGDMSFSEFQTAIKKWEETVETQRGIIVRLENENASLRAGVAAPPDDDLDIPASLRRAPR
jgi:predicted  nucleic acid-binding Zn-ribbon protein